MQSFKSLVVKSLVVCVLLGVTSALEGCDSNSNEKEFLNSAPPGAPRDHPEESYSQRRARTVAAPPGDPKSKKAGVKKGAGATTKTP